MLIEQNHTSDWLFWPPSRLFKDYVSKAQSTLGKLTIFNIKNHSRLITAIHYNHQLVFVLLLLTHNEYTQGRWKNHL